MYHVLFAEKVRRKRAVLIAQIAVVALMFSVGLALAITALSFGYVKDSPWVETFKVGAGLAVSAASLVTAKELLGSWESLAPFENLTLAMARCSDLPPAQLEVYWAITKEMIKRL